MAALTLGPAGPAAALVERARSMLAAGGIEVVTLTAATGLGASGAEAALVCDAAGDAATAARAGQALRAQGAVAVWLIRSDEAEAGPPATGFELVLDRHVDLAAAIAAVFAVDRTGATA